MKLFMLLLSSPCYLETRNKKERQLSEVLNAECSGESVFLGFPVHSVLVRPHELQ